MTRKKVKLAYITNDSSRKATFKKRKKGLIKKVNELSTLCGITACAIVYSPYDTNPEVWPSNSGVQRVVSQFRTLPAMDQHKKMVDQEAFLKQRITKAFDNLKRQRKDNRELEMTEVMFQCLVGNMGMFHLNIIDLNDLGYLIEQYLKDINRRIEILQGVEIGESSNAIEVVAPTSSGGNGSMEVVAATTTTPPSTIREVGSSSRAAPTTFFNLMHQHEDQDQEQDQEPRFRHQVAPHAGFFEQARSLNLNQDYNQNQQMFMEMMNHRQEQMGLPFVDVNHHHHHHQSQQHQIPGDSSTAPATATTNPNLNHNIWFR